MTVLCYSDSCHYSVATTTVPGASFDVYRKLPRRHEGTATVLEHSNARSSLKTATNIYDYYDYCYDYGCCCYYYYYYYYYYYHYYYY
eukprot:3859734-Pyramimonas_sp.AAC.1